MFTRSLTYLKDSTDAFKTVFVGGILLLLGFLVVPTVTVVGYLMRVLRRTSAGDETAPTFDDFDDVVEMTKEGIPGFVVAVAYGLVPAVIVAVVFGGAILSIVAGGSGGSDGLVGLGLGGFLLGSLLGLALGLVAAYVVPAALANVAEHGTIGAGFDVGALRPVLLSGAYATGWLTAFAVLVVGGFVAGLFNLVPPIGTVLGVFVQFYFLVAAYYVIGRTWGRTTGVAGNEEPVADERPVV